MASLTVYSDVVVPQSLIAAGVTGRQVRRNTRVSAPNGRMRIIADQSRTIRQYEFGIVPLTLAQWQLIEGLYEVTDAGAFGMLMSDPKDNQCAIAEGLLYAYTTDLIGTIGTGYGVPDYQLHKRYTVTGSSRTKDRIITRPVAAAPILRGGVAVTYGAGAGNVALDADTGRATFVADTSETVSSITVGASTVLNFAGGTPVVAAFSVGERVYLSGITGTAAAALNGLSHAITAKGASSLTISTSTAGLAVTAPGTAYKFPQESESLTWSGSFYVPVHFRDDSIDWDMVRGGPYDTRLIAGPNVVLDEVLE